MADFDPELAAVAAKFSTEEIAAFGETLLKMKPVQCSRCGAPGETAPWSLDAMIRGHREMTAAEFRGCAIGPCLRAGWTTVSFDDDGDAHLACPDCATREEAANAKNIQDGAMLIYQQQHTPGSQN